MNSHPQASEFSDKPPGQRRRRGRPPASRESLPTFDASSNLLRCTEYSPGSALGGQPTGVVALISCAVQGGATVFRGYIVPGTQYKSPNPYADIEPFCFGIDSIANLPAICNAMVESAHNLEAQEPKYTGTGTGKHPTLLAATEVVSLMHEAHRSLPKSFQATGGTQFNSVKPDFKERSDEGLTDPAQHPGHNSKNPEYQRLKQHGWGKKNLPRFTSSSYRRPATNRDVVFQSSNTVNDPDGPYFLIQQGTGTPRSKVSEYKGKALEGFMTGTEPPPTLKRRYVIQADGSRTIQQDQGFLPSTNFYPPPLQPTNQESHPVSIHYKPLTRSYQLPNSSTPSAGSDPLEAAVAQHRTTGPQFGAQPTQLYSCAAPFIPQSPYISLEDSVAPQSRAGFAYPAVAYPINPPSLPQQPPGFVLSSVRRGVYAPPPSVQYGAYGPPSAQQIDYTGNAPPTIVPISQIAGLSKIHDTEAELPPSLNFAGGVPGFRDYYGHPSHTTNPTLQTLQNQDAQYGAPVYVPYPASNPVTTLSTTAHGRNEEAEVSLYRRPVNLGTDVRLVDPETINSGTQLERRVQPSPRSLGTYVPQSDVPWTNTLTYDALATQQQPIPSSAPGPNTQQSLSSIHAHLLRPVDYLGATGVIGMTGEEYFGSSRRIQGPRDKRRKKQDR
jgi:hypothetical protein